MVSINNLGLQLLNHKRFDEAEPLFRRAVDLSSPEKGVLAKGHWVHAVFQSNLANCLAQEGKRAEAEPLINEALAALIASVGEDHPNTKKAKAVLERVQALPLTAATPHWCPGQHPHEHPSRHPRRPSRTTPDWNL